MRGHTPTLQQRAEDTVFKLLEHDQTCLNSWGVDAELANFLVGAVNAHEGLVEALEVMTDHAGEKYPHFESERGQRDIKQAQAVLAQARGEV